MRLRKLFRTSNGWKKVSMISRVSWETSSNFINTVAQLIIAMALNEIRNLGIRAVWTITLDTWKLLETMNNNKFVFRVARLMKNFKTFPSRHAAMYSQKLSTSVPTVCINIPGTNAPNGPLPSKISTDVQTNPGKSFLAVRAKERRSLLYDDERSTRVFKVATEDITRPARMQEFFIRICQGCSGEQPARLGWKPRGHGSLVASFEKAWREKEEEEEEEEEEREKGKKGRKRQKRFRDAAATNLHTAVIQVSVGGRIRGENLVQRALSVVLITASYPGAQAGSNLPLSPSPHLLLPTLT